MVVGTLRCDLLLADVHSLKQKRAVVRPIVAELRRRFDVAAAETGEHDLYRRVQLAVATVASTHGYVADVLDGCERMLGEHPEVQLLATRRRVLDDDDLD